jgi:RNA exonuclease 1
LEKALRDEAAEEEEEDPEDAEEEEPLQELQQQMAAAQLATSANAGSAKAEGDKGLKKPRKKKGVLSLQNLVQARLGRVIQNHGNRGHDSLEDAIAARDLVHLHVMQTEDNMLEAMQ